MLVVNNKKIKININKQQKAILKDEVLEYGEEEDIRRLYSFLNP